VLDPSRETGAGPKSNESEQRQKRGPRQQETEERARGPRLEHCEREGKNATGRSHGGTGFERKNGDQANYAGLKNRAGAKRVMGGADQQDQQRAWESRSDPNDEQEECAAQAGNSREKRTRAAGSAGDELKSNLKHAAVNTEQKRDRRRKKNLRSWRTMNIIWDEKKRFFDWN
jgi:hypothetical protein